MNREWWSKLFSDKVYSCIVIFQLCHEENMGPEIIGNSLPMSMHLCLAVCCLECQYFQCLSWSSLHFSSPNTTITTLCKKQHMVKVTYVYDICLNYHTNTHIHPTYPDFADGMVKDFAVVCFL